MTTEPNFPPEVTFGWVNQLTSFEAHLIDGDTIRDLVTAAIYNCQTASQAYRCAKIQEILEQNTSSGRGAEKEVGL